MSGSKLRQWTGRLVLGAILAALSACEPADSPPVRSFERRIVSLSPAITQMIIDLNRAEEIVGVHMEDQMAGRGVTVVGDLYRIDYEKLIEVDPTDVFLQCKAEDVPSKLRQLAADHDWRVHHFKIETTVDVLDALYDVLQTSPRPSVGDALGATIEAPRQRMRVQHQLAQLQEATKGAPPVRVLMIVGGPPLTAAGKDTFLDEMLTYAGGRNAVDQEVTGYPPLDKESVLTMRPDVVLVMSPRSVGMIQGSEPTESPTPQAASGLTQWFDGMDIPAVTEQRLYVIDDPLALLPSTSMTRIAAQMAKRLHPDLTDRIDEAMTSDPGS